jgi:hypothetical protein
LPESNPKRIGTAQERKAFLKMPIRENPGKAGFLGLETFGPLLITVLIRRA